MEKVGLLRKLDTIAEALVDIRMGKLVIVVDDEDRENEGDFIVAAEKVTPDINISVGGLHDSTFKYTLSNKVVPPVVNGV